MIFTLTARYYIAPSTEFSFLSPGYENITSRRVGYHVILAVDELYWISSSWRVVKYLKGRKNINKNNIICCPLKMPCIAVQSNNTQRQSWSDISTNKSEPVYFFWFSTNYIGSGLDELAAHVNRRVVVVILHVGYQMRHVFFVCYFSKTVVADWALSTEERSAIAHITAVPFLCRRCPFSPVSFGGIRQQMREQLLHHIRI